MRDRKGVDTEGREGGGEIREYREGKLYQDALYEKKNLFSI